MFELKKIGGKSGAASLQEARDLTWSDSHANISFNISRCMLLDGRLDIAHFSRAIEEASRVHDALRTHFVSSEGALQRMVEESVDFAPEVIDRSDLAANDALVEQEVQAFMDRRFELDSFPLFRVLIMPLANSQTLLAISMAHAISDLPSMQVLINDVESVYRALREGQPTRLPDVDYSLADFVESQQQWAESADYAACLDEIRQRLEPGLLKEATEGMSGHIEQNPRKAAVAAYPWPGDALAQLRKIAASCDVTEQIALLAVTVLALSAIVGKKQFFMCFISSNRQYAGLSRLVGHLANAVPIWVEVQPGMKVGDFVRGLANTLRVVSEGGSLIPLGAINEAVAGLDPVMSLRSPFNAVMTNLLPPWQPSTSFADLAVLPYGKRYAGYLSNDLQVLFLGNAQKLTQLCRCPEELAAGLEPRVVSAVASALAALDRDPADGLV